MACPRSVGTVAAAKIDEELETSLLAKRNVDLVPHFCCRVWWLVEPNQCGGGVSHIPGG